MTIIKKSPVSAALVALVVALLAAAAPTTAQNISVTVGNATYPPNWVYNGTEWRNRIYNSLRLTPLQVRILEGVLDARDVVSAPVQNATWTAARAASSAVGARLRNSTALKAAAGPILEFQNEASSAVAEAKESLLSSTESNLLAASGAVSRAAEELARATTAAASGSPQPLPLAGQAAALAATSAASLIAKALNVTAEAVGAHLADLVVLDRYREAARLSKLQSLSIAKAKQQGAYSSLEAFHPSMAPVTTSPAPVSAPSTSAKAGGVAPASSTSPPLPPLSPKDQAAAAAFLAEAAAAGKKVADPVTSTTVVKDLGSLGGARPSSSSAIPGAAFVKSGSGVNVGTSPVRAARAAALLKKQQAFEEASSSGSSSPSRPHPATLVDESDAKIAAWLSEKPAVAASQGERDGREEEHLADVARWIASSPEMTDDHEVEGEVSGDVEAYASRTQAAFSRVASSDAAPLGGSTSREVVERATSGDDGGSRPARLPGASPPPSFYSRRYNVTAVASETTTEEEEAPSAALGAPTFPATSLDAMALQASPSIKAYYSYLALRAMGFSRSLSATATAATASGGLAASLQYALQSLGVELSNGAEPVWVGQSATPFVVPQAGASYSFAEQERRQTAGKRRLLAAEAPAAPPKTTSKAEAAKAADEAAPADPSVSPASPSAATTRRKLTNFGTNTSPPPPPGPPPPGQSPSLPGNPAFGTYSPFRADNTLSSDQLTGYSNEPPDGGVCAGAGYVLTMANVIASVRSQSDPATSLRTTTLFDFFQGSSGDDFGDPHCIYHAASGRFFAVAYQTTSTSATFIPLAMSPVNNPLGTWTVYRINSWNNQNVGLSSCNTLTPCFGDFPQIGANENSVWVTSNQFAQFGGQLTFAGVLITAFGVSNLVAGGTQTPFQTSSTQIFSVKPMNLASSASTSSTMYLANFQTSTSLLLLKYTNTNNLASNTAPTLASQNTVASSISVGGPGSYSSSPTLANGVAFDGGDNRLIGLSYANGRLLASATTFYGSTSAPPKVGVVYWFIDAATATQVYAGIFADPSWNAWTMSTALDANNVDRAFVVGMIATAPGYSPVTFPTASVLGTLQVGVGSSNGAALVSAQDGQYIRGFSNPIRTGDYSTSAIDPGTGVAWLLSEQGQTYATTSSNNWGTVVWKASFT